MTLVQNITLAQIQRTRKE